MPAETLNTLIQSFLAKKEELDTAESALSGARGELESAQAVVLEKQGLVDTAVGSRNESRTAYNASIDELIVTLQGLKVEVA